MGVAPAHLSAGDFGSAFSRPVVLGGDRVAYLNRSGDGLWMLSTQDVFSATAPSETPLNLDAVFANLRLFADVGKTLWLAGEDFRPKEILLRIGRLENSGFADSRTIGVPGGFNTRVDLAFPGTSEPWVAWRCRSGREEDILAEDTASGLVWRLSTPGASALSAPRIRTARGGGLWVFWTGIVESRYVVSGRRFDGRSWSEEVRIADNDDRPCLDLDAGSGLDGILRVAWSAYDGRYYRVMESEWSGGEWSEPRRLADRAGEMETNPRFIDWGGGRESVVWSALKAGRKRILARFFGGPQGDRSFVVSDAVESPYFEAAGTEKGLVIIGEGRPETRFHAVKKEILDHRLATPETGSERFDPAGHAPPSGLLISTRLESEYIGFGDSITYGTMYREYAPDKGYIPRLDLKLDAAFGPTTVVNEGYPGEETWQGLARIVYGHDPTVDPPKEWPPVLTTYQGRYLLLMEGTNDVKLDKFEIPVVLYNLKEICKRCLEANVMPLIATVIPRRDDIWDYEYFQGRHYELEAGIRALAPQLPIPLVEMEQAFDSYPGGPENLLSDDVHPNEAGYVLMTDVWYAAIRALPFPPVNISFLTKSKASDTAYLLTWEANPKIADVDSIKGFRIYRKKATESASSFVKVGQVGNVFAFLDRSVDGTSVYDYVITTVTKDNVEGAGSAIARR